MGGAGREWKGTEPPLLASSPAAPTDHAFFCWQRRPRGPGLVTEGPDGLRWGVTRGGRSPRGKGTPRAPLAPSALCRSGAAVDRRACGCRSRCLTVPYLLIPPPRYGAAAGPSPQVRHSHPYPSVPASPSSPPAWTHVGAVEGLLCRRPPLAPSSLFPPPLPVSSLVPLPPTAPTNGHKAVNRRETSVPALLFSPRHLLSPTYGRTAHPPWRRLGTTCDGGHRAPPRTQQPPVAMVRAYRPPPPTCSSPSPGGRPFNSPPCPPASAAASAAAGTPLRPAPPLVTAGTRRQAGWRPACAACAASAAAAAAAPAPAPPRRSRRRPAGATARGRRRRRPTPMGSLRRAAAPFCTWCAHGRRRHRRRRGPLMSLTASCGRGMGGGRSQTDRPLTMATMAGVTTAATATMTTATATTTMTTLTMRKTTAATWYVCCRCRRRPPRRRRGGGRRRNGARCHRSPCGCRGRRRPTGRRASGHSHRRRGARHT